MNLRFALLVGGNEFEGQFERLAQNPDVIIATPGRIMHHLVKINNNNIYLYIERRKFKLEKN
jgi:ATP-dependent RNA helicase DDX54/DBP10